MGLEGWLGLTHVFMVSVWSAALVVIAAGRGADVQRPVSVAAAVAAFGAVLSGVWLLHREPALLTMTHMHIKAAALIVLGSLDHLLIRGHRPGPLASRGPRVGVAVAVVLAVGAASLLGPEAA